MLKPWLAVGKDLRRLRAELLKAKTAPEGWEGFYARLGALWCKVRFHDVTWRTARDIDCDCPGDIVCGTCNVLHWCRWCDRKKP